MIIITMITITMIIIRIIILIIIVIVIVIIVIIVITCGDILVVLELPVHPGLLVPVCESGGLSQPEEIGLLILGGAELGHYHRSSL